MAELSSPGRFFNYSSLWVLFRSGFHPRTVEPAPATKHAKYQKAPGEGTFMRTRSSVAVVSSGPARKQEW